MLLAARVPVARLSFRQHLTSFQLNSISTTRSILNCGLLYSSRTRKSSSPLSPTRYEHTHVSTTPIYKFVRKCHLVSVTTHYLAKVCRDSLSNILTFYLRLRSTMPPIRSTPVRSRYAATIDDEEDDGFNPAWAQKPNTPPPALTQPEPVVQEESPKKLPPPNVVVTHLSTNRLASGESDHAFRANSDPNSPSYDNGAELDGVTLGLLLPLAFVYNTVRGVAGVAGGVIQAGYRGTKAVRGTIARVEGAVRKVFPGRYDPMRGRKPKTPVKKTPKDSLLALPPHMVGATP